VNGDPGWRAEQDGRPIALEEDQLGFLVLRPAPAARTRLDLIYEGTAEQRVMAGVSALAWCGALALLWRRRHASRLPRQVAARLDEIR